MLEVQDLVAFHGHTPVLRGVHLQVPAGAIVAVLGRNGSGRSSLAKTLMGMVPAQGVVRWQGQTLLGLPTYAIARQGVGYVAEERAVFPTLSVHQNLLLGLPTHARVGPVAWQLDDIYQQFPMLATRRHTLAGALSGGEQQMLALGRALMGSPSLMVMDEPTEGLAPEAIERVTQVLRSLRSSGVAVLLMEQKLPLALSLADSVLVMGRGQIVFDGTPQALQAQPELVSEWLEPW